MNERRINLHLVSEATGETVNTLARATTAQFESTQIIMHRWSLIRTSFQLHRVLEGIEHEPGPVLSTLVDHALRADRVPSCIIQRLNDSNSGKLPWIATLTPAELLIARSLGLRPIATVSATCCLLFGGHFKVATGHRKGWEAALDVVDQAIQAG